jgi:hypothetical protein
LDKGQTADLLGNKIRLLVTLVVAVVVHLNAEVMQQMLLAGKVATDLLQLFLA